MLWGVSALKCFVFQKFDFSKFLIDRTCCLTDRKCDKNLGYNLPGLIGAWLVLDRSNLFFDRSKIGQWVFRKIFLSHFLHTFQIFSKAFSLSLLNRSNLSFFFFFGRFLPKIFKRFLSSSLSKSLLPFFFSFKSSFSCSVVVFLLRFSNWICFRVFNFWVVFFHIWFMGFCL